MTTTLHLNINQDHFDSFERKCSEKYHVKHTDMLREMIQAFNEGRLTIRPSQNQKHLFSEVYENKNIYLARYTKND